jgi:hypothetical protein
MKGQAVSIDLVLSIVLFSLLVFGMISFLTSEAKNTESRSLDAKRDRLASSALYQLAMTPGRPENWNSSTCQRIGISCDQGKICKEKADALSSLYSSNYSQAKSLLNLDAYDVSIFICSPSNYSSCDYNITTGGRDAARAGSTSVSREEVISALDGNTVSVIIYAWG